jgi:2-polyprenyl-6-methoxyphenol hydroxylase-like FAD-dependent oxidoreductase
VIHEGVLAAGIAIEYGKRLVAVEDGPDSVTAKFEDGSTATADVLIGADGIHSVVRTLIDPAAPGPQYTGLMSFGFGDFSADGRLSDGGRGPISTMHFAFGKKSFLRVLEAARRIRCLLQQLPAGAADEPSRGPCRP